MHSWGDGFPYFGEVGDAADYIGDFCVRWGRIPVRQTKEKWGTARVYCGFGWAHFHCVLFPQYMYSRFPNWLWTLDLRFSYSLVGRLFWRAINLFVVPYHRLIYRLAYKRAIRKWPMIRKEILCGADWNEYLEGL